MTDIRYVSMSDFQEELSVSTVPTATDLVTVRLSSRDEFDEATDLYRRVFGYQGEEFAINPMLMGGIVANGGSAVGVRDSAGTLVGFAYGFPGHTNGQLYHYSQAAVIEHGHQGKGIGRLLKFAQRDVALENGMLEMRWAYDPFYARNGHFNLDSLGAVGWKFLPNYYGTPGSDRIIVRWDLEHPGAAHDALPARPTPAISSDQWGGIIRDRQTAWVPLPGNVTVDVKKYPEELQAVRASFMRSFGTLFGDGYQLRSCVRVDGETSAYRLELS